VWRLKDLLDPSDLTDALRHDMAVFVKGCPECVDELGTLVDEPFASAKQDRSTLLLGTFGLDEPHFRLPGRYHDGLRIGSIVLLSLYEGLHVARRNQLHLVTKPDHFSSPVMSAATSFHHDQSGRLLGRELGEVLAGQLFAEPWFPVIDAP
jgi:hypothetical protein